MKIAIVGGTGFVGRHVVEALQTRGHSVIVLARREHRTPPGAAFVACDVARGPVPEGALGGCDAVVNLTGIKRETGTQTFEAVHVEATRRLIAACHESGVRRFAQVSVVCSRPDSRYAYHDTKWRAEEAVAASGLEYTILRPGVIYGPGDDMITHLVRMIRSSPVFPVVGRGESLLQPVDVRDVAVAVAAALDRPQSIGARYDIVGPERLPLRAVVQRVADGVGLRLFILPTPLAIQRIAVRVMDALMPEPLSTPSQLQMLAEGLYGDKEPARQALGLIPRPFTTESVRQLEGGIGALFGLSLRLVESRSHAAWLSSRRAAFRPALALAALAAVLPVVLGPLVANVWYRLGLNVAILSVVALACVPIGWRELCRPTRLHVSQGLLAAFILYVGALVVAQLTTVSPALTSQMRAVYSWKSLVPGPYAIPLLLLIVLGEEIVWRNAITLPFAARLGPLKGTLAAAVAFSIAHVSLGVPLLLAAALAAGAFWSALVVKTRSAIPALVSHAVWDLVLLFWLPLVAS